MKAKILAGVALLTVATAGTLTYAASTDTGSTVLNRVTNMHLAGSDGINHEHRGRMGGQGIGMEMRGMGGFGMVNKLTDAEKTKLATMTDTEKRAFLEAKRTADKAARDAKEAVIDKLINGEALSDTEKATLETIRTERAQAKADRIAREAKMAELKPILEKLKAGTTLTADEQAKLDAFKAEMPQGGKWGHGGKMRGGMGR